MSICSSRFASLVNRASKRLVHHEQTKLKPQQATLCRYFASTTGKENHPADGPNDFGYTNIEEDGRFENRKPTLEYAKGMPGNFSEMRHEQIIQLSVEGSHGAIREALIRNVMSVDSVEYDEAEAIVEEIGKHNRAVMKIEYFPYQAGITFALGGGILSFPLVFHQETAMWFNEKFVTSEVPEMKDLETIFEVGSWSWGWMEPILGQASFALLILQFARSQAVKLGIKPYGDAILSMRSKRLKNLYPQYNALFIGWFADSESMYGNQIKE